MEIEFRLLNGHATVSERFESLKFSHYMELVKLGQRITHIYLKGSFISHSWKVLSQGN